MMKAKELGITQKELNALVRVRDGLAAGTYKHVNLKLEFNGFDDDLFNIYPNVKSKKPVFNMGVPCVGVGKDGCGTAACIGGWVALDMGKKRLEAEDYVYSYDHDGLNAPKISKLFYPYELYGWDKITTKQAVKAIDNFLETGDPQWSKVAPKLKDNDWQSY